MNAHPRVSIILRTHNRPALLTRALLDIAEQDFVDWELIVINDKGDREAVEQVLEECANALAHAPKVLHLRHPVGRDAVLAVGLGHATGEFLAIHDDDDTWSPSFLSTTIAWLDSNQDRVAVAVSTSIIVERVTGPSVEIISEAPVLTPFSMLSYFDLFLGNRIPPIGMLVRTEPARTVGGFDESLSVLGDWDFVLRLAAYGEIGFIGGPPLAFWRQRPDSSGALSNSVHGESALHDQTDRDLRDRALRTYVAAHGTGGLLYVSRFLAERLAANEQTALQRIDALERSLDAKFADALQRQTSQIDTIVHVNAWQFSIGATLRRGISRLRPRFRRAR